LEQLYSVRTVRQKDSSVEDNSRFSELFCEST